MDEIPRQALGRATRIVVKLGTNVVTTAEGAINRPLLAGLAQQIVALRQAGKQVLVITSGAARTGLAHLGLPSDTEDVPTRQAAASVGQIELVGCYREIFARFKQPVAQVLLTQADITDPRRYLHLRNTLSTLLARGALPILNENDPVSIQGVAIGENDRLAAIVAARMDAELLVLLSDVDGLFTGDPRTEAEASLIDTVTSLTREVERHARESGSGFGRGGMVAKLQAAKAAMNAGVYMVICRGSAPDALTRVLAGDAVGTLFVPRPGKLRSRKQRIGFAVTPKGHLVIDDGAKKALVERGSSLLAVGIEHVSGQFRQGDVVSVVDSSDVEIARGLVNYRAEDVRKIRRCRTSEIEARLGHRPFDEVIHRDNLVLLH
ncbi:MAG: glutamate 5-kinase [Armatimonadota bacterium]|nr:MAG: glutamate 5-kinase [Armatimonadota bacterium]